VEELSAYPAKRSARSSARSVRSASASAKGRVASLSMMVSTRWPASRSVAAVVSISQVFALLSRECGRYHWPRLRL
jgi:hypothetical protein